MRRHTCTPLQILLRLYGARLTEKVSVKELKSAITPQKKLIWSYGLSTKITPGCFFFFLLIQIFYCFVFFVVFFISDPPTTIKRHIIRKEKEKKLNVACFSL